MIVECPKCHSKYKLEESKFADRAQVTVRCTKCWNEISVTAPEPVADVTKLSGPSGRPQLPGDKNVAISVIKGPLRGKVFPVSKPQIVIGRAGAEIDVDDTEVSRKHCGIEIHGSTATLIDMGSTNGIFVNEERVDTCELEHLSEFRIGQNTFVFIVTDRTG